MTRTLIPLIKTFQHTSIFVVGDVMLDVFVSGSINRISPEAPVPVLNIERTREMLGGAGNVVRNLKSLGCHVHFAGITGTDQNGDRVESLLNEINGLNYKLLRVDEPAIVKTRYISNNQQVLRTDVERKMYLVESQEDELVRHLLGVIGEIDVLIVSDYNKGTVTTSLAQRFIAVAREHRVAVFVDPKGRNYSKYKGATLIKPNFDELKEYFHDSNIEGNEVLYVAKLTDLMQSQYTLLTRGGEGMILYDTKTAIEIESLKKEVFDVSGAGDSVIATVAAAFGGGSSMEDAVRLGNIAGGVVVGKPGTAVVMPDELIQEIQMVRKIYTLATLQDLVESWRANHYRVGFTNGCFDVLHQGHISLLKFAKNSCDKLIVGLNGDSSVKALKGSSRPIKNQEERALIMAEFTCVDAVVIFDELTPELLIHALRPDVLIKGGDYSNEQIVGSSYVSSYGGKVLTSEYKRGHSSTRLVELIAKG